MPSPDASRFDVIVIGGAASGGTFALRMARAGWRVAVIEKSEFPRRKVCGEFLSATNAALLKDLGISEEFMAQAGPPVDRLAIFYKNEIIHSGMPAAASGRNGYGAALGRDVLDDWLLREAKECGATIFQPAKALAIQRLQGISEVEIECSGSSIKLRAPIIVAAHGSWGNSSLPSFPTARAPKASDLFGFKAHFRQGTLAPGLMPCLVFPGGYGGVVETNNGRISLSCCVSRRQLARWRAASPIVSEKPGDTVIRELMANMRGLREMLGGAVLDGPVLSTGPIHPGIRKTWGDGIFRIGNAAGEAHPIIAEGISMAMQSAWLLSEAWLAEGPGGDQELVAARYRRAWRQAFAGRIQASKLFAFMAMNPAIAASLQHVYRLWPRLLTHCAGLSGKTRQVVRPPSLQTASSQVGGHL